MKSTIEDQL